FLRNGALNARNFFAPKQDSLKRNQFGGSIGGPIKKDELFFFGTYQGTRVRTAAEGVIEFVPTQAERNGDFSDLLPDKQLVAPVTKIPFSNNQIPTSRFSPVSEKLLEFIPLPNGPGRQVTFLGPRAKTSDDQFMVKLDYVRGKHQINGRYFFSNFQQPPQTEK